MTQSKFWILATALLIAVSPALAQPGKQKHGQGGGGGGGPDVDVSVNVGIVFSDHERRAIYEHYGVSYGGTAKGLPPGQQKRLAKGKPMPPGIAKKHLPTSLDQRLGVPGSGTARVIIGNDVVLIQVSTGLVLDVIAGVIGH